MRTSIIVLFILCSTLISAQNIDNARLKITLKGERAEVLQKDVTAGYAIGLLVDNIRAKDFVLVDDGIEEYTVYQGNPTETGFDAIWWIYHDPDEGYCPMYIEDYIGTQQFFSNLADCKKVMKAEMQAFYKQYGTLDPEM